MTIRVDQTRREWIVAQENSALAICVDVVNGEVQNVQINYLNSEIIYTSVERLKELSLLLPPLLEEITAARKRTEQGIMP